MSRTWRWSEAVQGCDTGLVMPPGLVQALSLEGRAGLLKGGVAVSLWGQGKRRQGAPGALLPWPHTFLWGHSLGPCHQQT